MIRFRARVGLLNDLIMQYSRMTNLHPLSGVLLKINRAKRHFEELNREIAAFQKIDPFTVVIETN